MKFKSYRQFDEMDCGPTCLRMIAKHYGRSYSREYISEISHLSKEGVSMGGLSDAADRIGLSSMVATTNFSVLAEKAPLPCIAHWKQRHFVVVYDIKKKNGVYSVMVSDPAFGSIKYSENEFKRGWLNNSKNDEGVLLLLEPGPNFSDNSEQKNLKQINPFAFLLKYLVPYRQALFQLLIGLVVGSLIQLIFPFLTQSIVDRGINYQDLNFVQLVLIAQLVLFASQASVQIIRNWILLQVTTRVNIRLISTFLMKLMRLPISYFETKNIGDLMQRINDHERVRLFLSSITLNSLFSVFNIIIFSGVLLYYDALIFLILVVGITLYFFWAIIFLKKRAEIDFKRFDQASGNQSSTIQLINGMQEIKLNGSQQRRRWEWEAIQVRLFKISLEGLTISQAQTTGTAAINELKNIVITFIAATSVIDGEMTLGMMLSIQYIVGQMNLPLASIITFIQSGQDAKISLDRITEVHSKENEDNNGHKDLPSDRSLSLENLSFRYGGSTSEQIIKRVNVSFPQEKVTAIVGASGSGKTTIIKLLLKFYERYEGRIKVGEYDLKNIDPDYWRSKCGCVMQDGYIFSDSILRNITESGSLGNIDKERLQNAIKIANLQDLVERLPSGLNTRIGASGLNLSGGQKQRILIARAVYKNPDYLIFDEATSALDSQNEKEIMEKLYEFFHRKTVIIVAHRLSTVKNADNIIVLESGTIVEQGNHSQLTKVRGKYYQLVKNQLELGN